MPSAPLTGVDSGVDRFHVVFERVPILPRGEPEGVAHVPKAQAGDVAAAFRTIFAQTKTADVHAAWDKTRDESPPGSQAGSPDG